MKIVAPAGNMERFYAAIKGTADEIYLGLKGFGARRSAENFSLEEIKMAIDYAHLRGSRVFLTLNTIITNREIDLLYPKLKDLYNYGLDAIIVQDIGYADYLHKNFPNIEIHGSTQMTVANYHEINYLKTLGFKRIVLPRELSFEEIKEIRENTDMELEVFVSGSLCISFSGNCYMSSFIGGRSGNRGMCAQPCRKEYKDSCGKTSYFLSPKDQLLGFAEIEKLKEIGIESIKIEGRMKDPNYVYETVSYYRSLINGVDKKSKTPKIFNRGYSKGYFYNNEKILNTNYSYNMGEKIGEVTRDYILLSDEIVCGDGVSFISQDYKKLGGTYISKINFEKSKENRKIAYKGERISLNFPKGTKYVFKNYDKRANDEIFQKIKDSNKKLEIRAKFIGKLNLYPKLILFLEDENIVLLKEEIIGENSIEKARKKVLTEVEIKEKLSEIGESEFIFSDIKLEIDDNIFIPLSEIKNIKRKGIEILKDKVLGYFRRDLDKEDIEYYKLDIIKDIERKVENIVIVSNQEQYDFLDRKKDEYNIEKIYFRTYDIAKQGSLNKHNLENPMASNLYELLLNKNKRVLLNWNMNVVNSYSIKVLEKIDKLDSIIISPEINFSKIRTLGETRIKKSLLIYSKLKGMTIDVALSKDTSTQISNKEGDKFNIIKNEYGTELFLEKPLNIINIVDELKNLYIDRFVLEFTNENIDEIKKVLKQLKTKKGEYREYNYKRGVY